MNRYFSYFAFLFFSSIIAHAQNRIATQSDRQLYGSYIQIGDLIIDTPTKRTSKGTELIYYFMAKQWPQLRNGATIWLDGTKLGHLDVIKFCNTASPLASWHIESASFKIIPGTQLQATSFFCQGLKHLEVSGETETHPGLLRWDESRKFLTGSFGIHIKSKMFGGHGINVSVLDKGTIKLRGFECQFGFSAVRINGGDYDLTVQDIEIKNFYIHDTGDGEGFYIGATHKPPYAKIKNLKIHDGIIARTAAEALQLQHLAGGTDVHNITIRSANTRWMNEFRAGQDTGIQWNIEDGENAIHHLIVDGFASVGLVPFGNDSKPSNSVSHVSDILFNDGIDTGIYLHKSGSYGVEWIFENLTYRSFDSGCYYDGSGRPERKYIISSRNGTDRYTFKNIVYDGSKPGIFQDTVKSQLNISGVSYKELPPPEYVNSGFYEAANKVKQWTQYYAGYFPASRSGKIKIPTDWKYGDIAIETEGEYSFFKCIQGHTATEVRPASNPYFKKLTWDSNGVRSDQPGWEASLSQSNFPPDDLRLVPGSYWYESGLGFPTRNEATVQNR